jgi:DNA-binding transcriptional LysR family regulator
MEPVDLNLLRALDVLLAERSVTAAARRLSLSPSAMSRTLSRLRRATGDPLLVQAGRSLVPTPHAEALGARVHALARDVEAVLSPTVDRLDLASLDRTFTLRAGEGFLEQLAAPLVSALTATAPRVRLRFTPKPDKDAKRLRDGEIDLEIGVLGVSAPEMKTQLLYRDRFVGVARKGHPVLGDGPVTPQRYAACNHVTASRRGEFSGPVDDALERLGLSRTVTVVMPGFPDAIRIAQCSNLVGLVPRNSLGNALTGDHAAMSELEAFDLPIPTPPINISAAWHPRMDVDPAHRWLRETVMAVCRQAYPS